MIFLKRFKAHGFKSYAHPVELDFKNPMTGIVGPNGAGKSNVVDGIKWVLGEQSIKQLRGKTGEDVIFHGSKGIEQSQFAEVTLVFNNESGFLHHESKELSVTRRVARGEGSNEYLINDKPARLKDIQDIFLDTGLSKGSLGIIGQGTVQWFAEAKSEDRRKIFEEAAGIGRYSKRKQEAQRQLDRTTENLVRAADIVNELRRDLDKLEKQAEKAKTYNDKKKQLSDIEITLLANDIKNLSKKMDELKNSSSSSIENLQELQMRDGEISSQLTFLKEKVYEADRLNDELNERLTTINEEITKLETLRSKADAQISVQLNSADTKTRSEGLKKQIANLMEEINDRKSRIQKLKGELEVYHEAKTNSDNLLSQKQNNSTQLLSELMSLKSKKRLLEDQLSSSSHLFEGVKVILAHKNNFPGIINIVGNLISYEDKYAKSLDIALGSSQQSIIVNKDSDAEQAVKFLKQNQAGTATFLPLESIKPRSISSDHLAVLEQSNGFLGSADSLLNYDRKLTPAIKSLLGGIIIADDISNAVRLSKLTYQSYRVVTLDGDIIQAGGAITGGFRKSKSQGLNLQKTIEEIDSRISVLEKEISENRVELERTLLDNREQTSKINEKQISMVRLEEFIESASSKLDLLKIDFEKLTNTSFDSGSSTSDSIIEKLNSLIAKKDRLVEELKVSREAKLMQSSKIKDLEAKFFEIKDQLDKAKSERNDSDTQLIKINNIIENSTLRLIEVYKMTAEFAIDNYSKELPMSEEKAREIVSNLRTEIEDLGPVNLEAIEEFGEKEDRFKTLNQQKEELETAQKDIIASIAELDRIAIESFNKVIGEINAQLPSTFQYLFGGGSCSVEYTDPNNILESGIEVIVSPPGKNVNNLTLLSGGEKTLVALSVLFAILKVKLLPMIILDEAESALDPANVERFGEIINANSKDTQFILITHRPGTMERCHALFGATMQTKGVTSMLSVTLAQAERYIDQTVHE